MTSRPPPDPSPAPPGRPEPAARPGDDLDPAAAADFALLHRPSFSVRKKIAFSFLLCFVLIGAVSLASSLTLRSIEHKLHFLEVADRYTSHIQQARRYEKNFFLYGTDLPSAQEHVRAARETLSGATAEIQRVAGRSTYEAMVRHLARYELLVARLQGLPPGGADSAGSRTAIETELRVHGGEMIDVALRVAEAERQNVRRMLRLSKQLPVASLVVLLVLILYVTNFLARQMLAPLGRIVDATARIAKGDFTPIRPARRYRDEFTRLALAINRMMHELDRRQEMLAESQKLRAIGTLTAGVAHELNNPINNISLTAEALLEDYHDLDDAARLDMCRDLLEQAERAHGVVANLLDFSRQREAQVEPLEIGTLLAETTRLVANQLKLTRSQLELRVPDGLPPIRGDRQQLRQVFVNLYLNAIDAMPRGGVLRVEAARALDAETMVRIDVADSGAGIPAEVLPYIFDPFFSTKGAKGTGLGLAVSYGIVTKHGGTIEVQSELGRGTTFTVVLPLEGVEGAPPAAGAPAT